MNAKELGQRAETMALRYLQESGYRVCVRNFSVKGGEIDLIMEKDGLLVCVEVKSSNVPFLVDAIERVTPGKAAKICKAARAYLSQTGFSGGVRFDIFAMDVDGRVQHVPDAFSYIGPKAQR